MKTSFFRILPFTAAVLLATSCSKDENNDQEVVNNSPENVVIEKNVVKIPFSVKVNQGKTLSKIAYSGSESAVTVSFTDDDVTKGTTLTVIGTGIEESILTLEKQGDSYVFTGDINLLSDEYRESFENGNIDLTGSFGEVETEIKSSTLSLADLMENCNHKYLATFKSNDASIDLYDQNSYIAFTVAEGQYKVNIGDNWYPQGDAEIDQDLNKLWVVLPAGNVSGRFIKAGSTVEAGQIYTITRTDVIDLGPSFNILWKTENLTLDAPKTATIDGKTFGYYQWNTVNQYYSNGTEHAPNREQLEALASLAKGGFTTYNGMNYCKEFSNEYGAVYFPAAGCYDGSESFYEGQTRGVYWSPNSLNAEEAMGMSFYENKDVEVSKHAKHHYFSVRLVRDINN